MFLVWVSRLIQTRRLVPNLKWFVSVRLEKSVLKRTRTSEDLVLRVLFTFTCTFRTWMEESAQKGDGKVRVGTSPANETRTWKKTSRLNTTCELDEQEVKRVPEYLGSLCYFKPWHWTYPRDDLSETEHPMKNDFLWNLRKSRGYHLNAWLHPALWEYLKRCLEVFRPSLPHDVPVRSQVLQKTFYNIFPFPIWHFRYVKITQVVVQLLVGEKFLATLSFSSAHYF